MTDTISRSEAERQLADIPESGKRARPVDMVQVGRILQAPAHGMEGAIWLMHVDFPPDPYGLDHAKRVLDLAGNVAASLELGGPERETLRQAALFHELGRPGSEGERVAALEAAFRRSPEPSPPERQEEVIRLVLALLRGEQPRLDGDLRLVALADAEWLEEARFAQSGGHGWARFVRAYERLVSPWARQIEVQRSWRARYGV